MQTVKKRESQDALWRTLQCRTHFEPKTTKTWRQWRTLKHQPQPKAGPSKCAKSLVEKQHTHSHTHTYVHTHTHTRNAPNMHARAHTDIQHTRAHTHAHTHTHTYTRNARMCTHSGSRADGNEFLVAVFWVDHFRGTNCEVTVQSQKCWLRVLGDLHLCFFTQISGLKGASEFYPPGKMPGKVFLLE